MLNITCTEQRKQWHKFFYRLPHASRLLKFEGLDNAFNSMRVIYIQYTNPAGYPPLQHSSRILAKQGWKVLFLGSGAQGASGLEFPGHPNIRVKRLGFCPAGWRQKVHYGVFASWVLVWVLLWRPSWVYASDPLSCPVAVMLSFVPGVRVLYHEHDSPNSTPKNFCSKFERFVLKMRRKIARRADLSILPNERRVSLFKRETHADRPVVSVWNCPALEEVVKKDPLKIADRLIVFFHGSIVPARLPMTVLDALARLPSELVLTIAGYETAGHAGYVAALIHHASNLGLDGRFNFMGAFSRYTLFKHCRNADVGLAFMPLESNDANEETMTGASNKPFDYLACGVALLVSERPDWEGMFVKPGYGLSCNPTDPDSIARQLLWFFKHREETRSMGCKGRQRIVAEWNYERQFSPVLHRMEKASRV